MMIWSDNVGWYSIWDGWYAPYTPDVYHQQWIAACRRPLVDRRREAADRYWKASTRAEEQAAYYEMLLKGCKDGYPNVGRFRSWVARKLRTLAAIVDDFD